MFDHFVEKEIDRMVQVRSAGTRVEHSDIQSELPRQALADEIWPPEVFAHPQRLCRGSTKKSDRQIHRSSTIHVVRKDQTVEVRPDSRAVSSARNHAPAIQGSVEVRCNLLQTNRARAVGHVAAPRWHQPSNTELERHHCCERVDQNEKRQFPSRRAHGAWSVRLSYGTCPDVQGRPGVPRLSGTSARTTAKAPTKNRITRPWPDGRDSVCNRRRRRGTRLASG